MYFTKDTSGFRAWFTALQSNGTLRVGLIAADFTITVVNQNDNASTLASASESSVKAGLYTFQIPSSFLTTHGVGEYGILIEVNTFGASGPPQVRTAFADVLKVSQKDLNDIPDPTTIADIQTAISNIENTVNVIDLNVEAIFDTLISAQHTVVATTSLSDTVITTDADLPDDYYNGQLIVLITALGTTPVILARTVADYASADGSFIVSTPYPLIPSPGDRIVIVPRTSTASVDNNAIANAVWTVASTPTTPGTYGELVNIIGSQTSLIPGLV